MASSGQSVLCVYRYDPLDRLADCSPAGQGSTRFFYQKTLLATQIQGQVQHTLMRTDERLLACLSAENNQRDGTLLVTDQQQSVTAAQGLEFAYTPYGHRHPSGSASLPGFTGQRVDPVTGHYLLGNGYRAFNPVLMRFNSPDSLSPFGEGGVNAYGYCGGDPVNRVDLTGHMVNPLKLALKMIKANRKSTLAGDGISPVKLLSVSPSSSPGVSSTVGSLSETSLSDTSSIAAQALNRPAKVIDGSIDDFTVDDAYTTYKAAEYNDGVANFNWEVFEFEGSQPSASVEKRLKGYEERFSKIKRKLEGAPPPSYKFVTQTPPPYGQHNKYPVVDRKP
ncbi:RHS repeat-associated core domain-containing protein [Pseudomonas syringae]|uniref:RHS repeat-associated core domain-containing protein n=1 Tax=Pseudomonas syringae TaxID=317 RepID=UPI001916F27F|nr:RHS repeat-associated core domain-containing protein [Pseudomonas syringae]QQQ50208.1 RHS repeat-associated core domain-containing protein [Pseudomonas syringae]